MRMDATHLQRMSPPGGTSTSFVGWVSATHPAALPGITGYPADEADPRVSHYADPSSNPRR